MTRPKRIRGTTRREFLWASTGAAAAAGLAACRAGRPARLDPVRERLAARVEEGEFPGVVWLIARGDEVFVQTLGMTAVDGKEPMHRGTIFRIASMTKPITATAVAMLIEEGRLALDAPVERWLPELANRRVLRRLDGPLDDTVPALRPITVRDLLANTLGFGMLFDESLPIQRRIDELQLVNGAPVPMTPHAPDEWMLRFGTLPLMHQPGAAWMYNTGSLLQGILVSRASGTAFPDFVHERILDPLGMHDTGFYVPAAKLDRLAGCGWFTDPQTGAATRMDADGEQSAYARPPVFPSGAAGLVSTADDFLAFARLLRNAGVHAGTRLLEEHAVRAMTTQQLTPEQEAAAVFFPGFFDTWNWGFGTGVLETPGPRPRYGWDGGFGTSWLNDPVSDRIGIVMTQSPDFLFSGAREEFWDGVSMV